MAQKRVFTCNNEGCVAQYRFPGSRSGTARGSGPIVKLYRSAVHPHHWVAYSDETGWMTFPAAVNGWKERRPATGLNPKDLARIPVWLAFNTGLLEAVKKGTPRKAA